MANPFEDEDGSYYVLMNDEGQHSIWPTFVPVPTGWRVVKEKGTRAASLKYVEEHWTDMRPNSLIERMNGSAKP
jgi:MbtH protein